MIWRSLEVECCNRPQTWKTLELLKLCLGFFRYSFGWTPWIIKVCLGIFGDMVVPLQFVATTSANKIIQGKTENQSSTSDFQISFIPHPSRQQWWSTKLGLHSKPTPNMWTHFCGPIEDEGHKHNVQDVCRDVFLSSFIGLTCTDQASPILSAASYIV